MTSRWADEVDEDDEQITFQGIQEQEPILKDGERTFTEIVEDPETGKKKKVTKIFKLEKKVVSKGVIERKHWAKFGGSKRDPAGPISATTVVGDPVTMFFVGSKETESRDEFKELKGDGKSVLRCRYCQDNHFSAKCPYKDTAIASDLLSAKDLIMEDRKLDGDSKGTFTPPHRRGLDAGGRRGETMMSSNRKDEYTIRVSNLPESMTESDMQELCVSFGKIDRIFLAKDRVTGACKGFAFVTFESRENASRALECLNGYGYDHLIMSVEWSKPAAN